MAYNYTASFVAYCKGAAAEEIAEEFKIPLKSLKAKMRQEGWKGLADSLVGQNGPVPSNTSEALARIEANRAKNFETATKLRDGLDRILDQLEAGTLRVKKRFQRKGQIIECDAEPTMADLVQFATAMRMVHDMTYRALGDLGTAGSYKADAAESPHPTTAPIQIILPPAIAIPRVERAALAARRLQDRGNGPTSSLNN